MNRPHLDVVGAALGAFYAHLRWSDIDLDRGEVLIAGNVVRVPRQALVHKDTETHAKRRVAVGAGTIEQLLARRVAQAKDALAWSTGHHQAGFRRSGWIRHLYLSCTTARRRTAWT